MFTYIKRCNFSGWTDYRILWSQGRSVKFKFCLCSVLIVLWYCTLLGVEVGRPKLCKGES